MTANLIDSPTSAFKNPKYLQTISMKTACNRHQVIFDFWNLFPEYQSFHVLFDRHDKQTTNKETL